VLSGTAPVESLAGAVATIPAWSPDAVTFEGVTCFQLVAELRRAGRADLLPPGLDPTDPPSLSIQAWTVSFSPWGRFSWAFSRVSCRSGVRARGFTRAAVANSPQAAEGLASVLGFPCRVGAVALAHHYDGADLDVDDTLRLRAVDAQPLGPDDVQYTGTMNLAHTPAGLRLVQVETKHDPGQVQRMIGHVDRFEAAAWGDHRLDPYTVIAATVAQDRSITVPPLRFVCRPDVSAFEGTERISDR
jgi:hypothetical protein